jgi:glycosyltransferase involved in cell wall biosynthesis
MRIGIVPELNPFGGGIYQYSLTMLRALDECRETGCDDALVVFTPDVHHPALAPLDRSGWTVTPLSGQPQPLPRPSLDVMRRIVGEGPHRQAWRWLRQRFTTVQGKDPDSVTLQPAMNRLFRGCGVDLMLYPAPRPLSFEAGIPYIMAIHDLQHRLQPEFPEVSSNGEWESREYYFRNGSRYATLLLADSEVGKEDILTYYGPYGVTADRVRVLPFLPASYLAVDVPAGERQRVRMTYRLPERYLFYPAQFWPHKNHGRIVQALGLLKNEYRVSIPMVFSGSHAGDIQRRVFREVISLSQRLGLASDIHCVGYVPDADMSAIYAEAAALVMPTFFGPTNIPVMEAWAFGCPALTSDIRGIREHVQDAAVLVDPRSTEALAEGIYRIWTDEHLRTTLRERGRRRLSAYTPDDYRRRLVDILDEAKKRVSSETSRIAAVAARFAERGTEAPSGGVCA